MQSARRMKTIPSILALSCVLLAGCESMGPNTQRGAGTGAAAGAVIGGIIGHQSGETVAGAALGAAAGGLAGGAIGRQQDRVAGSSSSYDVRDSYGYTDNDYLSLLTQSEMDTLRARASGRGGNLTDYLTNEERANLRARASARRGY
ncbi:MAG: hypothetical protein HYV96_01080 [Opitutae bacterium]|nr:hypothetical protein [Opitutae bacterium]